MPSLPQKLSAHYARADDATLAAICCNPMVQQAMLNDAATLCAIDARLATVPEELEEDGERWDGQS